MASPGAGGLTREAGALGGVAGPAGQPPQDRPRLAGAKGWLEELATRLEAGGPRRPRPDHSDPRQSGWLAGGPPANTRLMES